MASKQAPSILWANGKWFSLTVKYQPLKCKIVYTSILPSNHLHPHFHPTQTEKERERETTHLNLGTTPQPLPSLPPQARSHQHRFLDSRKLFLFSLPLWCTNRSLISDLQTDLVAIAVASFRTTRRSHHCQTHPPILPPSNPPTDLWSFTSLFLSISLPLSLTIGAYFLVRLNFSLLYFLLIWFIYLDFLL